MIFTYMILTALMTTAKGFMGCNVSETTKHLQCVGALGESLIFNLPTNVSRIALKQNHTIIFTIVQKKITSLDKKYRGLFTLITNGSLKLNNATKSCSGDYVWEVYDSNGKTQQIIEMHLEIQAPVSEPAVSQMCLSPEQMEVSCSSDGDEVEFILNLDHHLLIQTRTHIQSQKNWENWTVDTQSMTTDKQDNAHISNVSFSLYGQLTGNLRCHVWNKISRDEKGIHLKSCIPLKNCKDSVPCFPAVTVAVITSVSTLLLHVVLSVDLKHLLKKTRPMTINESIYKRNTFYSAVTYTMYNNLHIKHSSYNSLLYSTSVYKICPCPDKSNVFYN